MTSFLSLLLLVVFIIGAALCVKHDWDQGDHSGSHKHDADGDFIRKEED
ncbi:TMhelix containing protein [Vibrio phage 2.275.O._10N.286.54.E11]|nr:TMhelix containing protein [Vibrio phage 2.275.O._10N.286.54.E11]